MEVSLDELLVVKTGTARMELERGRYILGLAIRMTGRCRDAGKIIEKLGARDDFVQQVALVLTMVLAGELQFDPLRGISFEGFVLNQVRIVARRNCIYSDRSGRACDVSDEAAIDVEAAPLAQLTSLEHLSPRERIFARCSTGGLAKLIGQTDRNVRLERARISKRLREGVA